MVSGSVKGKGMGGGGGVSIDKYHNKDSDIHTYVASDFFNVELELNKGMINCASCDDSNNTR